MKKNKWMNLVMAILVAGLFLTVSCAKKTVVTDETTIEDQAKVEADAAAAAAKAKADEEAAAKAAQIKAQELADQMATEKAEQEAKIMAAKKRFVNEDIHFEYDSSDLSAMAKTLLKEKADWLKDNASISVTIEGHCDERGTTEYNLALGERRASTVKTYLINLGISGTRLNTISYGEEKPKVMGTTESAYRENRRAHFAIK